jgi:DedD protein
MMEKALKERIIGAIVLVLFVVLVVPIFLDGPTNDGEIVSEQVPLPGQSGEERRTIVLDRDRTEPVPASQLGNPPAEQRPAAQPAVKQIEEPPQDDTPDEPVESKPEVAQPEPAPVQTKPAPAAVKTSPPVSSTGMWAVQMGSFGNQQNAEKLAADLRKQGFAAFLSQLTTADGELHRVRIGPQKDRESAEAMAARLQKAGHKGQVVPHP